MALNRCKNGHMYSARKYGDTCPYCNTEIERVNLYSNTGRRTMIDDPDKTMPIMGTEDNATGNQCYSQRIQSEAFYR